MHIVLSLVMLASIACLFGAGFFWRRGGSRQHALLMVVLAMVGFVNVLIWTMPDDEGAAPFKQLEAQTNDTISSSLDIMRPLVSGLAHT